MASTVLDVRSRGLGSGTRVRVFDDVDRVTVLGERQVNFSPKSRPDEVWSRCRRYSKLVFSFRRGVLDVYSCSGAGLRTVTPRLHGCIADIDQAAGSVSPEARANTLNALGNTILDVAARHGLTLADSMERRGLYTALASLAYPLLGLALRDGGVPPPRLPLRITRALRRSTAREGAAAAFGPGKANRPVVRTLAHQLRCGPQTWIDAEQTVSLQPILVAAVASRSLSSAGICDLLAIDAQGEHPAIWDSSSVTGAARDLFLRWESRLAQRIARDALGSVDGLLLLADAALAWDHLGRPRLPSTARSLTAVHALLVEAATNDGVVLTDFVPTEILDLDGLAVGDLRLSVPRSPSDLAFWGAELENCLAAYVAKIVRGDSWILGIRKVGQLKYALEISPLGGIVQFKGVRNSEPDRVDAAAIVGELSTHLRGAPYEGGDNLPTLHRPRFTSLLEDVPF